MSRHMTGGIERAYDKRRHYSLRYWVGVVPVCDQKLAQGREATKQLIADNAELSDEIEAKIREALKNVHD